MDYMKRIQTKVELKGNVCRVLANPLGRKEYFYGNASADEIAKTKQAILLAIRDKLTMHMPQWSIPIFSLLNKPDTVVWHSLLGSLHGKAHVQQLLTDS